MKPKYFFGPLFILALIFTWSVIDTPRVQAQKSNITVGDGGTNLNIIKTGRATLVSGTVAVTDSAALEGTYIKAHRQTVGGTKGVDYEVTRSAGTSFTITSLASNGTTQTGDTSVVGYFITAPSVTPPVLATPTPTPTPTPTATPTPTETPTPTP